ncbi:uncharacterized protein LOC111371678 [Olea europaea var. sylvestris]|uniref:uncharacterized protein LOC111371678 n=1 Tax=Olea europaea var. sylvestris TaxID=158386 RepID=UPI000C1D1B16|nr:uncharacterized protein LOC111371678 [Olea europaea var. sylvestris]
MGALFDPSFLEYLLRIGNGTENKRSCSMIKLCIKNEHADDINNNLIEHFLGDVIVYYSFDEILDKTRKCMQEAFLNSLTSNGIPPHELVLKISCPVILLRNINPAKGLCNGTRLICKDLERNVIHAEIATGEYNGNKGQTLDYVGIYLPQPVFSHE